MRFAVVSDIHANRPAWFAVLDDIAREGVDGISCLGDIIGYGPRPRAVLDSVLEHCENIVLGNHDAVIAGKLSPDTFNPAARSAIEWTRDRLGEEWQAPFASLPLTLKGDGMLLTHGDVEQPGKFRYVTRPDQARASFKAMKGEVVFFGHTHQPGVFTCGKSGKTINRLPPQDLVLKPGNRYMINPGSVGDPRCRSDLRASYCIYDTETRLVHFRRVEFDVDEYRRDFAASGLVYKPFFLRLLDAESARDGDAGAEVADHRESVTVDAGPAPERVPRLRFSSGSTAPAWQKAQAVAMHQAAQKQRKRSRAMAWLSLLLVAAAGVALGFALPLAGKAKPDPQAAPDEGVATVTISSPPGKVVMVSSPAPIQGSKGAGSDLERIMAEGWEDPDGNSPQ